MTLTEAREQNLDVYILPNTVEGERIRQMIVETMKFHKRNFHLFEEEIGPTKVICIAAQHAPSLKPKGNSNV